MSEFRKIVEGVLRENKKNKIKAWLKQNTIPEYIYHIFGLDDIFIENKDETKNSLWLASNIYNEFLEKIHNNKYKKTKFGGIVNLKNFNLTIEFNITGRRGDGIFDKANNKITVYVESKKSFTEDEILENALIHEIAHVISYDDYNNFYNYIKSNNRQKYLTQPVELEANKIALCNHLIKKVLKILKQNLLMSEVNNSDLLRKHIDNILQDISKDEKHIYYDFLVALNQDKKLFKEIYFEIVSVCIEYIQEHLIESHTIAIRDCSKYSEYTTSEEFLEILSENIKCTEEKIRNKKDMSNFREIVESVLKEYGYNLDEGDGKVFDKDSGYNVSKDELVIFDRLKEKYPNIKMSVTDDRFVNPNTHRHFQLDFYDPDSDTGFNYNKHCKHGRRMYNPKDPNCQADVRWLQSKSEPGNFYEKILHTWRDLDPLKREVAKQNGLKFVEWFNMDEFNKWYENPSLTYEEYKYAPESMQYNRDEYFAQKARGRDIYGLDSENFKN